MPGEITRAHIEKSMSYEEYIYLMDELIAAKKTTGPDQSEKMAEYTRLNRTRLNRTRIKRIEKSVHILPEVAAALQKISKPLYWVVLVEAWCGDVAQNLPIIRKMVDAAPSIELCILLRDENPEIMNAHLTNGGKAIPKLICLNADKLQELGTWGPRPAPAQAMITNHKSNPVEEYSEVSKKVQEWYLADKGVTVQRELVEMVGREV